MYRKETDPALSGGYCFVKDESESEYFAKETHTHTQGETESAMEMQSLSKSPVF